MIPWALITFWIVCAVAFCIPVAVVSYSLGRRAGFRQWKSDRGLVDQHVAETMAARHTKAGRAARRRLSTK